MNRGWLWCFLLISQFCLAAGDGLLGNYYEQSGGATNPQTSPFSGTRVQRIDAQVDFDWGASSPIGGVGTDYFTVRWSGEIEFSQTGNHRFRTVTDDGVRLYIDWNRDGDFSDSNETLINNWSDHSSTTDTSSSVNVSNISVRYPIRMDFYERGGSAQAELYWNTPGSGGYSLIPQANLYSLTPPTLSSVSSTCAGDSIDVAFSKEVASASATTLTNYAVSGGVSISAATLVNSTTVRLSTSALSAGASYTVTVSNVQDTAGQTIVSGSTASLTAVQGSLQAGLLATYYDQNATARAYFTGSSYSRIDSALNFDWGTGAPITPVGAEDFSVRWEGYVRPTSSGSYTFYISGDDGIRLYLDGNLIANYWSDHADAEATSSTVSLTAGQNYRITYEMYERGGYALARLRWSGPSIAYQAVPAANLYHCMTNVTPQAQYQMDESAWNGTAGEVNNSLSSSYDGRGVGVSTATARVCRGANFPSTLTAPAYVSLPASEPSGSTVTYSDFSFGSWVQFASAGGDYTVLAGTRGSGASLAHGVWLRKTSSTGWSVYLPQVQASAVTLTLPAVSASTWYYVGLVRRLASVSLYLYNSSGTLLGSATGALTSSANFTVAEWSLGFNAYAAATASLGSNGRQFYGLMDESRYYNSALTSTQLGVAALETHSCPTYGPNAFSISVGSGTASNCQPQAVTISALNSGGAVLTGYTGTVSISTSTGHGNWSVGTANGSFSAGSSDSGAATYTFVAGDNGSIVLNLSNTHAENLTINVSDSTYGVSSNSGSLEFRDNVFVVTPLSPSTADPPDVIAGRAQTFQVAMWTSGSGTCAVATGYTGSKALKAWCGVDSASPSGTVLPTVNAVLLPSAAPTANNLTLTFSAGVASISLLGPDVARLAVNLRDDSRSFANAVDISGGSATFVIRPFGFYLSGVSTANDANGGIFRAAGATFPLSVRAVQYDAVDDNGSGQPSVTADLSNNAAVAHFGNESPAHSVTITPSLALPAGGAAGALSVSSYASFSGGSQTQSTSYSEVGIINLSAALAGGNYLGSGRTLVGYRQNVGRFTPHHFKIDNFSITSGCSGFTYMGQNFTANARLTAENAAGIPTQNYTGSFAKLDLSSAGALGFTGVDTVGPTPLSSRLAVNSFSGSWSNGIATISNQLTLNRASTPDGAYAQFTLGMAPIDTDGVSASGLDLDTTGDSVLDSVSLGLSPQRFGRLYLDNALGSELISLAVPMRLEYWEAAQQAFVRASDDSCSTSQFSLSPAGPPQWGNFTLSAYQNGLASGETAPAAFSGFSGGSAFLTLSAPGSGNQGAVTVTALVPDWLEFDFDSSVSGDEDPFARASFGLFRGHDPIIFWREFYR